MEGGPVAARLSRFERCCSGAPIPVARVQQINMNLKLRMPRG